MPFPSFDGAKIIKSYETAIYFVLKFVKNNKKIRSDFVAPYLHLNTENYHFFTIFLVTTASLEQMRIM